MSNDTIPTLIAAALTVFFFAVACICAAGPDPFTTIVPAALALFCGVACAILAGGEDFS